MTDFEDELIKTANQSLITDQRPAVGNMTRSRVLIAGRFKAYTEHGEALSQ